MKIFNRVFLLALYLLSGIPSSAFANPSPEPTLEPTANPTTKSAETQELLRQTSLRGILNSMAKVESELKARQEELRGLAGQGRQEEITQQIQATALKLDQLRRNFTEIASGIDPELFSAKPEELNVDWSKDLRDILSPLINEVRRLTSRPRELDRLRTIVEEEEAALGLIEQAKIHLERQVSQAAEDPRLLKELKKLEEDLDSRKQSIATQLGITRQKLDRKVSEQRSIGESVQNIFQLFFKSRGLNLILALVSALLFWLAMRRAHLITGRFLGRREQSKGFYQRLMSVFLMLATAFGAIVVFLITLYFVGDWVLLILALMLILGIVWTSKQAVHQFWTHATLLLNMGSCREGERVVYNGIPWELRSLSLYCNLVNPSLTGGNIMLPIRDLSVLRSRGFEADEVWFPTNRGDWIMLSDDSIGTIEFQSIETVRVRLTGGAELQIPSAKFIEMSPKNLSRGFRHRLIFGLDYRHQESILSHIPDTLKAELEAALAQDGFSEKLIRLEIDFEEAASSSLNLSIEADFHGTAAGEFNSIRRTLSAGCVAACNKHRWNIPFPQMSIHLPESLPLQNRI